MAATRLAFMFASPDRDRVQAILQGTHRSRSCKPFVVSDWLHSTRDFRSPATQPAFLRVCSQLGHELCPRAGDP